MLRHGKQKVQKENHGFKLMGKFCIAWTHDDDDQPLQRSEDLFAREVWKEFRAVYQHTFTPNSGDKSYYLRLLKLINSTFALKKVLIFK